jgi:peptidoglycan LD-endopeptidase LytH
MRRAIILIGILALAGLVLAFISYRFLLPRFSESQSNSNAIIGRWFNDPASRSAIATTMRRAACPGAPFILPSDGLIGLLWNDPAGPYTLLNTHTGIDVFGDGEVGEVPVYAAYDGLLTRRPDWLASVIIKHDDPLQAGRTIWTYYTHMAARDGSRSFIVADFPAGSADVLVKQGELLGYQGEFAGAGRPPIGMHLHFTIVLSEENGVFKNEAVIGNTLDPSPYLGMPLNSAAWPQRPIQCEGR